MDRQQLVQLIRYVVGEAGDLGGYATTIRLVKFLYLFDIEYQRRYGRTLTDLPWVFHLYGPYSFALRDIGRLCGYSLEREEFVNARGHKGTLFTAPYERDFPNGLAPVDRVIIDGLLGIWADRDTEDLLEYVYSTEPIVHGTRGEPLDWSVVPRGTRYYGILPPQIPSEQARRLRESVHSYSPDDEQVDCAMPKAPPGALERGLAALGDCCDAPDMPDGVPLSLHSDELGYFGTHGEA